MSYGLSFASLSAVWPGVLHSTDEILEVQTQLSAIAAEAWETRDPTAQQTLADTVIKCHELAHIRDVYSTELGPLFFFLEQARLLSQFTLCRSLHEYPVARPLRLPLYRHILESRLAAPELVAVATAHRRIHLASRYLMEVYFAGPNSNNGELRRFRNYIPRIHRTFDIFQNNLLLPRFESGQESFLVHDDLDVIDILEASALLTEMICHCREFDLGPERIRLRPLLNMFPRRALATRLFEDLLATGLDLEVLKYAVWKSLQGRFLVFGGHDDRPSYYTQHPRWRLGIIMHFLRQNEAYRRHYFDGNPVAGLLELDHDMCCDTDFEPISTYSARLTRSDLLFSSGRSFLDELIKSATVVGVSMLRENLTAAHAKPVDLALSVIGGFTPLDHPLENFNNVIILRPGGIDMPVRYLGTSLERRAIEFVVVSNLLDELDSCHEKGLAKLWAEGASGKNIGPQRSEAGAMMIQKILEMLTGYSTQDYAWSPRYEEESIEALLVGTALT